MSKENGRKPLLREGMTREQFEVYVEKGSKTLRYWKTCFLLATIVRVFLFVQFVVIWVFEMIQDMESDPKFNYEDDPATLTVFSCIELCPVIWAVYFCIAFFETDFDDDKQLLYYFFMVAFCTVLEIFCTAYLFFTTIDPNTYTSMYILLVYFSLCCSYHGYIWFFVRKIEKVDLEFTIRRNQLQNFYKNSWWENGSTKD